jgi:hypothetical protein
LDYDRGQWKWLQPKTLGSNPEILENDEIIERLNDRFDIFKIKKNVTHYFSTALVVELIRFGIACHKHFKNISPNALFVEEDTYAAVYKQP